MDETTRLRMRRAHANQSYHCICGKIVHGNGGKAMHFYVDGQDWRGYREGHRPITRAVWLRDTEAGRERQAQYDAITEGRIPASNG